MPRGGMMNMPRGFNGPPAMRIRGGMIRGLPRMGFR